MSRVTASLRRSAAFLLFTGAAALIAGAPAANTARAADNAPIAIKATELEPTPDPSLAFNGMAEAMGLFAKHGLTLVPGPKLGGGGPARVQAVVTDNTEVATSDIISVMGGIYSGAKIKILMVMTPYGDEEVWGQNKYKTMKDAVGQSWGVASLGGAQRFNAQMTAEGMGFKADAFQWIAISGADAARLEALDTGRTQLASLSHLGAVLAEAKGFTKQVHVLVPHTSKYTPPVPRLVVVAKTDWLKAHQAAATALCRDDARRQPPMAGQRQVVGRCGAEDLQGSGMNEQQLHAAGRSSATAAISRSTAASTSRRRRRSWICSSSCATRGRTNIFRSPPTSTTPARCRRRSTRWAWSRATPGLPDTPDWYQGKGVAAK